ncbi:MAG: putative YigZ family protein [Patiriisocius sp.]|jgi:uncharacterized YigZ family protein
MNEVLNYNTITENSEGFFKDKGSKFLGFAFHVKTLEDIDRCLKKIREKEYSARHHCYAYRLEFDGSKYRANDDGEPSHSAGDPILGQIDSFELTETLIIVVRYFGGTKLGVGGLIQAYRAAAKESLLNNKIVNRAVRQKFDLLFEYESMNIVMRYAKQFNTKIVSQKLEQSCAMTIELDLDKADSFKQGILLSRKVRIKKPSESWED